LKGINQQSIFVEDRDHSRYIETFFALQMFSSDKKEAVAKFGKFHAEITDNRCLDIDEGKKAPSDKDVRDLALDKYNMDLSKLQNMEQEIRDEIIKYLKKIGKFPWDSYQGLPASPFTGSIK